MLVLSLSWYILLSSGKMPFLNPRSNQWWEFLVKPKWGEELDYQQFDIFQRGRPALGWLQRSCAGTGRKPCFHTHPFPSLLPLSDPFQKNWLHDPYFPCYTYVQELWKEKPAQRTGQVVGTVGQPNGLTASFFPFNLLWKPGCPAVQNCYAPPWTGCSPRSEKKSHALQISALYIKSIW